MLLEEEVGDQSARALGEPGEAQADRDPRRDACVPGAEGASAQTHDLRFRGVRRFDAHQSDCGDPHALHETLTTTTHGHLSEVLG